MREHAVARLTCRYACAWLQSTLFNALSKLNVAAENYPFWCDACTMLALELTVSVQYH